MSDDIVATLRECAKDSRASEGDYYADQFATGAEVFDCAANEIESLRAEITRLRKEPRGWLTAEERKALWDSTGLGTRSHHSVAVVEALLARETPPRVKVPTWMHDDVRRCVIAAIRAAGGEVADE